MARVVAVHGIGKQLLGEESLLKEWWPALADGLRRAGADGVARRPDTAMAFYGDLFRPAGQLLAPGSPRFGAADVEEGFEQELLLRWWCEAAKTDPAAVPPGANTLAAAPAPFRPRSGRCQGRGSSPAPPCGPWCPT
ncbi:hypothetical protein ACH4VX_23050 [Streptomyces sp. NPDC020731]|uniref:hypothetical protein n=1 Tax=Streptomyces sp. NPDC020731 TaxID=3365085 RepID=UPI00378E4C74